MATPQIDRRQFVRNGSMLLAAAAAGRTAPAEPAESKWARAPNPGVALSYVNPYLEYSPDGRVSARTFFEAGVDEAPWLQAGVSRMLNGGVQLVVLSHGVNDPDLLPGAAGVDFMLRCLDALDVAVSKHPRCALIRTAGELRRAADQNKLAIVLHLTGAPISGSIQILRAYGRLGVRAIHPFIRNSPLGGDSASPGAELTPLGREAVREMERASILVDVAHANDVTFRQVMRIARRPVIDSHTACRSIRNLHRNRTDEQLRAIAATGGAVGVHFGSQLLADVTKHPAYPAWREIIDDVPNREARMRQRFPEPYAYLAHRYDAMNWPVSTAGGVPDEIKPPRAALSQLVDHIEHMVDAAGIDHVCIGSDYALSNICAGVETADKLANLAAALRQRGYGQPELDKILRGNLNRVLADVLPT
jgi:membrane dipeptidase